MLYKMKNESFFSLVFKNELRARKVVRIRHSEKNAIRT